MSHKSPNFANIWSSVFDASQIDFIVNVHLTLVTGENHVENCYFIITHVYRLYKSQKELMCSTSWKINFKPKSLLHIEWCVFCTSFWEKVNI